MLATMEQQEEQEGLQTRHLDLQAIAESLTLTLFSPSSRQIIPLPTLFFLHFLPTIGLINEIFSLSILCCWVKWQPLLPPQTGYHPQAALPYCPDCPAPSSRPWPALPYTALHCPTSLSALAPLRLQTKPASGEGEVRGGRQEMEGRVSHWFRIQKGTIDMIFFFFPFFMFLCSPNERGLPTKQLWDVFTLLTLY